jgi:ABC-2 type transport system ATP-binding protein
MTKTRRTPPATPAIHAQAVAKTYNPGKKTEVDALRNVNFSVQEGEVVGLIGPNGAGKSTLLRILLGLINADAGSSVTIFGQHPESLTARAHIGYQADAQYRSRTVDVRTFLELHAFLAGQQNPESQIDDLLKQFSLEKPAYRSLSSLSKGMRQKVELIFAFVGTPKLVFLDEPTAALDPPSVFELRDFLAGQKTAGVTIFFSSHNLTEVENVCDRVLFINNGTLVGDYSMKAKKAKFLEQAFRKHLIGQRPA